MVLVGVLVAFMMMLLMWSGTLTRVRTGMRLVEYSDRSEVHPPDPGTALARTLELISRSGLETGVDGCILMLGAGSTRTAFRIHVSPVTPTEYMVQIERETEPAPGVPGCDLCLGNPD
jgi:hypothetical protein